ncbi:sulfide dehydrogenase [Cupriavidus sp. UYMSc13B]|nr:sulfide dehydrogenase [Cupriavidus sp. UYMSc13B]
MRALLTSLMLVSGVALADEGTIQLKEGPGKDKVMANCIMCHSVDYIQMNSVFLDRNGWTATVNKMTKAMGAPIKEEDIPQIVDYLTKYYGK